jgi:hypothetical protein
MFRHWLPNLPMPSQGAMSSPSEEVAGTETYPNQGLATRSARRPDYEELRMREAEN